MVDYHSVPIDMVKTISFIDRSYLPKLPEGWKGPFTSSGDCEHQYRVEDSRRKLIWPLAEHEAKFLADLLNACYPTES